MEELNQKRPAAKRPRQNGETPRRPRQGEGKSVTKRAPRPAPCLRLRRLRPYGGS